MHEAIASPERRRELGEPNRRRAEAEFGAATIVAKLVAHYEAVLEREPGAAASPRA